MLIERCILQPGTRWVCVREVQKSIARSVKQLLEDKIAAMGAGALFDIKRDWITTPGDGVISFQGMQSHTAETIKSLEGFDGAWVEEAQALSQRSLDMLRPTMRKDGSELWFTFNPRFEKDAVDRFFRGKETPPRTIIREVNWQDNPWFPDALREEMLYDRRRDPDKYAHIWLGQYQKNSEARVFTNWKIDGYTLPKVGVDCFPLFGADWGAKVDPTALVRCWIIHEKPAGLPGRKVLYIDQEAWNVGCPINRKPALFRITEDKLVPDLKKWMITADSAWPDTISYMQEAGFQIQGAKKGPGSVAEGVEFLRDHDIIVHSRCKHMIDELTLYSYEVDERSGMVLPILADRKNHLIDALRYAVESTRTGTAGMIGFTRDEAARTAVTAAPSYGWHIGPDMSASENVRMIAPDGVTTVFGMDGRMYAVQPDKSVLVAEQDVGPLRSQGFRGGQVIEAELP